MSDDPSPWATPAAPGQDDADEDLTALEAAEAKAEAEAAEAAERLAQAKAARNAKGRAAALAAGPPHGWQPSADFPEWVPR
jgi:hypothetical protein